MVHPCRFGGCKRYWLLLDLFDKLSKRGDARRAGNASLTSRLNRILPVLYGALLRRALLTQAHEPEIRASR